MLPNNNIQISELIQNSKGPIIIFFESEGCEYNKTTHHSDLERKLKSYSDVTWLRICIAENEMQFPRVWTPILYYFKPGNEMPLFWRFHRFFNSLESDIEIVRKMMTGMTYEEARFTPEEQNHIVTVENIIEKEKEIIHTFPSSFQQARNLAKEMWKAGKAAAKGLPVLVSTEEGYRRLSVCESCEKLEKESYRCSECGCFMKTKTQLATASCPIGKWNAVV